MTPPADDASVTSEITQSMQQLLAQLVGEAPGVVGALVASADGFVLAELLPSDRDIDAAGLAAMSAAALALSNQLAATNGPAPASVSHHVSSDGQVMIVPIAHVAVLAMLATSTAEAGVIARAGSDAANELQRLFRGTAQV